MGQTSSQVAEHNPNEENGQISDGAEGRAGDEVATETPRKSRKRKSSGASNDVDDNQAIGDGVEGNGRAKRKNKRKKRKSGDVQDNPLGSNHEEEVQVELSRVEEPDGEEAESARALLQLRNDTQRDDDQSPNENDFPGSAQLVAESSPDKVRTNSKKRNTVGEKPDKAKRSRKKAKKSQSATQELDIDGNASPEDTESGLPQMSAAHTASTYLSMASTEQQALPQSTLSLDDIDSNDEALAPYLQSYENGELDTRFHVQSQEGSPDIDDSYTQLANDAFNEATAAALRTERTSRHPSQKFRKGNKTGRKRNSKLPEGIFASDDEQLEQPLEEPEQPLQKRRYKKRASKVGLDVKDDDELPVDPRLSIPGLSTMQLDNYGHPDLNVAEVSQQAKPGKLKRPSKAMPRRSNVQSSNLDNFVTRDQNLPHSSTNADDGQDQAAHHSDPNLDPELSPSALKPKKRRVEHITTLNASNPTFRVSKTSRKPREANSSSQAPPGPETSTNAQNLTIGPFSKAESNLIHAWRESYCAEHQWSHYKFDETVQANARNDNILNRFWNEICEQIPYRPRQAIQKFCRRHFHNFEKRGTWTPEDDETVKRLVAEKGKSWKAIAETMGRMQEDVRDRWRNYLYQDENRNTDAWTEDEVKALVKAVGECIWLMQNELQEQRDVEFERTGLARDRAADHMTEDKLEKLINWQIVSDRMQGQRSRLQCLYKWGRLRMAGRIDSRKAARKADKDMRRLEEGLVKPRDPGRKDWRARKATAKVRNQMLSGDKLDFLQALSRQKATEENHIVWLAVGRDEPWRKRWDTIDLKVAWIMMKKEIGDEGLLGDRYLTVVNAMMEKLLMEQSETGGYRWYLEKQANHEGADGQETELGNLLVPVQEELRGSGRLREREGHEGRNDGLANITDEDLDEYYREFDVWMIRALEELNSGASQAANHASQQAEQELVLDDGTEFFFE
ncbi:RNA polymerase I enhancer binding protein [Trapelia coarctata]|nr:RNA polymerase I enhancer binding protein [Trapelia coarctata]